MDPLTALGLAASVVQFVDFAARLIKQADEFADKTRTVGVLELQNVAEDLLSLTKGFRQRNQEQAERTPDEKVGYMRLRAGAREFRLISNRHLMIFSESAMPWRNRWCSVYRR